MVNETTTYKDYFHSINTTTQVIMFVLIICVYGIGVFLNTKIIATSKLDKGMTWKMDIFNSSMLMFHYAHVIIMHSVTFLVKDLHIYTGAWFCYASKAVTIYGNAHTTGHSLMISVMKCVMIVQWKEVRSYGEDKVKRIFFWLNIIYPLYILAIFNIVRPDFLLVYDGISQSNRCLGISDMVSSHDNNISARKLHNMCDIEVPVHQVSFDYLAYLTRKCTCWSHVLLTYSNVWNILEVFVYCKVFHFIRR